MRDNIYTSIGKIICRISLEVHNNLDLEICEILQEIDGVSTTIESSIYGSIDNEELQ